MVMWKSILKGPELLRLGMNLWPPFRGAGIEVEVLSPDFRYVRVALKPTLFNRNYVGTHFGGSLFAMTDPFYMLMLLRNLGDQYYVWDRSASIEYVAPGKGKVLAEMRLSDEDLASVRAATAAGGKYEHDFPADVVDAKGALVARVKRRIYVRLKPAFRPGAKPGADSNQAE